MARVVVDERPSAVPVTHGFALRILHRIETIGELAEYLVDPRGEGVGFSRARHLVDFDDQARKHPSSVVLVHVGVAKSMGFGMEGGYTEQEIAQGAPR